MSSEDGDSVRGSLKIVLPFREGKDDGKKFSVVNVIVVLSEEEGLREVGAGMKVTIGVFLHENHASSKERYISQEGEWFRDIRDGEDWGGGEELFEGIKCMLLKRTPSPGLVFLGEGSKGGDNVGVIRDELLIEIGKAKE